MFIDAVNIPQGDNMKSVEISKSSGNHGVFSFTVDKWPETPQEQRDHWGEECVFNHAEKDCAIASRSKAEGYVKAYLIEHGEYHMDGKRKIANKVADVSEITMEEAIAHYREAIRVNPDYAQARDNLKSALQLKERAQEPASSIREWSAPLIDLWEWEAPETDVLEIIVESASVR